MRTIFLTLLRYYLKLGFFFYYKEFRVSGLENIPGDKPVMLLPNHQNMLVDPLLVGVQVDRFPTFLTRSDVFKKGWIDKTFRFLGMLPIYRIRDGYASLKRNQAIFDLSCERLNRHGMLLMFPEGSSDLVQRLRKLSKGFTRLIFHALNKQPESDIQIIPIGINYRQATRFPDSVSLIFSEPLSAQDYLQHGAHGELIEDSALLRSDMQTALQKVVTSIPKEHYHETRQSLLAAGVDLLDPELINDMISSGEIPDKSPSSAAKQGFKKLLWAVLVVTFLPIYLLWRKLRSGMQELDYIDTFRYVFVAFIAPIYLLVLFLAVYAFFGMKIAALLVGALVVIELLYVKV